MLSWWTNMETIAELSSWLMVVTLVFAALTIVMLFLTSGKSKLFVDRLSNDLDIARQRIRSLEKAAEGIRKELLQSQQHQDINQLKLETSQSSVEQLRHELASAKKRLKLAEAAVSARQQQPMKAPSDAGVPDQKPRPEGSLTIDQREQLTNLLDPGPKGNVDIFCVMDDKISELTAKQLDSIMTADGWKTNGVAQSAFTKPPKGLVLAVNSKETAPSYASFLQRVFSTIGVPVTARVDSKCREWSLSIIVGNLKN